MAPKHNNGRLKAFLYCVVKTPQSKAMMAPEMVMLVCLICVIQDKVCQQVLLRYPEEKLSFGNPEPFFLGQTIEVFAMKFLLDLNNTIL